MLSLLLALPLAAGQDAPPLNVLWLTVEDMSPWIAAYGDDTVPTPHLDAFADGALRYDNAFASSPVCAPARTALICGLDPTRIGAMHMRTRSRSAAAGDDAYGDLPLYEAVPPSWARCFPEDLRRAGYYTTNNAKRDYQFAVPATVWDESSGRAHYANRPAGAPFFAVFNHAGTHESRAFPDARRTPPSVAPDAVPIPPIYPDTPAVRDALARTYDNIAAMDRWFGERLAELEAAGLADTTAVFFFSDHGVGLPRGKRSLYGTGTRVPLLVRLPADRWPEGRGAGTATERLVSFVDFGPTVLSLAGLDPDPRLDGRAFLGAHADPPRTHAFAHADRFDAVRDCSRSVTDGTRLVIRNLAPDRPHLIANAYRERLPMTHDLYALRDAAERAPEQWQLASTTRPDVEWYDRRGDPWETRNLAGAALNDAERAAFLALEAALDRWLESTGDLGLVQPEAEMVRRRLWGGAAEQPSTAPPVLSTADPDGPRVTCPTEGASIAYRFHAGAPWSVAGADALAPPPDATTVEARAHRLGYLPSATVQLSLP